MHGPAHCGAAPAFVHCFDFRAAGDLSTWWAPNHALRRCRYASEASSNRVPELSMNSLQQAVDNTARCTSPCTQAAGRGCGSGTQLKVLWSAEPRRMPGPRCRPICRNLNAGFRRKPVVAGGLHAAGVDRVGEAAVPNRVKHSGPALGSSVALTATFQTHSPRGPVSFCVSPTQRRTSPPIVDRMQRRSSSLLRAWRHVHSSLRALESHFSVP